MAFFIGTVLAISFLMHFYVYWRLFGLFGCKRRWGFWLLTLVGTVSLIGSRILESYYDSYVIEVIFVAAGYWLGVLWLLFCTLLLYEIARWVVPHAKRTGGIAILAVVCVLSAYATVNARRITVATIQVPGPEPMRLVQLSDVHIGSMNAAFIRKMVEKTNRLNPDKILITGDLVDTFGRSTQNTLKLLADFEAPVYFVSGNHEHYVGRQDVLDALRRLNVTNMDDRIEQLGPIQLIGIPDMTDRQQAQGVLTGMPYDRDAYTILMFHRPMDIAFLEQAGIDLTLVGHAHAGQIFPFNFIVRFFEYPVYGLHRRGDSFLYVTSGTGLWGPRMRLGTNNEIVVVELQ